MVLHTARLKVLWWSFGANSALLVAEVIGGIVFSSLALLADAAHMASDVLGLALAMVAHTLTMRPQSARHTYGLQRAEVLGALANSAALILLSVWIVVAAVGRLDESVDVAGGGVLVVATFGLAVNLGSAWMLRKRAGTNLNMRGAYLHMLSDALGSVGAIAAGIAIVGWDARWVDSVASIAVSVLVVFSAGRLLIDTVHVLLEGTPRGLDTDEVKDVLMNDPSVDDVHHLHMWSISSDRPALSAHVVLAGEMTLHDAQGHGERLKDLLAERFAIEHSTLELECHACEPGPQTPGQPAPSSPSVRNPRD